MKRLFSYRAGNILPVLTGLILVFSCRFSFSQQVIVVSDHTARAQIILPSPAPKSVVNAAKIMQFCILQRTGAVLPITGKPNGELTAIHIGKTGYVVHQSIDISKLDEDGFILAGADSKNYIILGGSDWGTQYGVYFFLEKYLGVVAAFPTDAGMIIPQQADLTIPTTKITENPVFRSRQFSPGNTARANQLGAWETFNRLRGRINFHHNLLRLFDPKEYYASHPGFYADYVKEMPDGVRWQPNFSAPGIADSASRKIIRFFESNPGATSYSLGVNDVRKYDQSPASLKRRNGKTNFLGIEDVSDDYYLWVNDVVKKVRSVFPEKLFGLLAYNNVVTPPSAKIPIDANVVPFLTYERLRWADSVQRSQGHILTQQWADRCADIGWYDYAYGLNYLLPRVWFHEMQEYLQWGSQHHVKYYYAELYPNWGEGPKPWIQAKLLWNPYYNVDSLLNVWYLNVAGKQAAPHLKAFYSIWETFWTKDILETTWKDDTTKVYLSKDDYTYLDAVPKDYIQKSDVFLNAAFQAAVTEQQKQRIQKLIAMWQIYKTAVQVWQQSSAIPYKQRVQKLKTDPAFLSLLNNLQADSLHSESIRIIKTKLKIN